MNETPLRRRFREVSEQLAGEEQLPSVKVLLGVLRQSAQELRDEGFAAELEVRPYQHKIAAPADMSVWANATLSIDGIGVDFTIGDDGKGRVHLLGNIGPVRVFDVLAPQPEDGEALQGLATGITHIALRVKAANEMFGAYSVNAIMVPVEKQSPAPRLPGAGGGGA
jgi:hypothetical protein